MKPYFVGKSKIHGTGLFASRDISAGEKIVEYKGETINADEAVIRSEKQRKESETKGEGSVYIFKMDDLSYLDGNFAYNDARYINHACRTNCEAVAENNTLWIYASKNIQRGEELFFDYAYPLEDFFENPCHCGFPECVGYIVAQADRPRLRKILSRCNHGKSILNRERIK